MAGLPDDLIAVPTGRHGLPPNVVAAHQRERLLAATIDLVAKRGYRGTSVDHIVKAARVGYVAFYDLFEGKEDCFLAAFDRIAEEARTEMEAAASDQPEWADQVCAGLRALVAFLAADARRARVGLIEVQAAGPRAYRRYEEAIDAAAPKLREGRALNPETDALSDAMEDAIIGGITWIFHQRLVKGEIGQDDSLLEEATRIALSPYLGEEEARRLAVTATGE